MRLMKIDTWLKSPLDRDIIARWTVGTGQEMTHALELPDPPDPQNFNVLAFGDTGDSERRRCFCCAYGRCDLSDGRASLI